MKTQRTRIEIKFDDKIETVNYVCYINKTDLLALCYVGKATKPAFYYRYRNISQLYESVKEALSRYDEYFRGKAERAAKMKELNKCFDIQKYLKIGDIIQNTWGYEQTNQEFYQVTGFKGRTQIIIKELCQDHISRDGYSSMSAFTVPVKDKFYKEGATFTLTCKASESNPFYHICNPARHRFYYFHVWCGTPQYVSWYA